MHAGIKSPKFIDPGIPSTSGRQKLAGRGFLETPELSGVKKNLSFEKDFMKEVNDLLTKARSNGEERDKDITARELEVHKREVASLQQTVIALKSEVRVKVSKPLPLPFALNSCFSNGVQTNSRFKLYRIGGTILEQIMTQPHPLLIADETSEK